MKKILAFLLSLCLMTSFITLVGCQKHEHTYSEEWLSNETHHYHVCTVDGCDSVSDKKEHEWVQSVVLEDILVCEVCNKTKQKTSDEPNPDEPEPIYTVSEEEWYNAFTFDDENFKAEKVYYVYDTEFGVNWYKIIETIEAYNGIICETYSAICLVEKNDYPDLEEALFEDDFEKTYYFSEGDTWYCYEYEDGEYDFDEIDYNDIVGPSQLGERMKLLFDYDKFSHDNDSHYYYADGVVYEESNDWGTYQISDVTIKFENKRVISFTGKEYGEEYTYTFEYGTVEKIEIPKVEQ